MLSQDERRRTVKMRRLIADAREVIPAMEKHLSDMDQICHRLLGPAGASNVAAIALRQRASKIVALMTALDAVTYGVLIGGDHEQEEGDGQAGG